MKKNMTRKEKIKALIASYGVTVKEAKEILLDMGEY